MIVYCTKCRLSIDSEHVSVDYLSKQCESFHVFDDGYSDNEIVIICFIKAVIVEIRCQYNVMIICPKIFFENNYLIDLSCKLRSKERLENMDMDFYGLPGFPGYPGYNLSIYTRKINIDSIKSFISKGSTGGRGQLGNPPGKGGKGGKGGNLIINGRIIYNGEKGDDGEDYDGGTYNQNGIQSGVSNEFGMNVDINSHKQIIYKGIIELDLMEDRRVVNFFNFTL